MKPIFSTFIDYFEQNFIGNNSTSSPRFEHASWIVFERIENGLPTTTNNLEGWHRGFNNLVKVKKPNLGLFVDSLRIETEKIRNKIARFSIGKFYVSLDNNKRREKLCIYVGNEKYMSTKNIFSFLDELNNGFLNNKYISFEYQNIFYKYLCFYNIVLAKFRVRIFCRKTGISPIGEIPTSQYFIEIIF
ncbi:hypothetical protein DMUE_2225 [Dictyocoela muelleri]|nr:hypothetical protein DMUE_2225 [Dictyocoela muelleri]